MHNRGTTPTTQRPTARAIAEAQVNVTARRNAHTREAAMLSDWEEQARKNALKIEEQRQRVADCLADVEIAEERLVAAREADKLEARLAQARADQEQRTREAQEARAAADIRLQAALAEVEAATAAIGA